MNTSTELERLAELRRRRREAVEDKAVRAAIRTNTKVIKRLEKSLSGAAR